MSEGKREEDDVYYVSHVYENCIMAFYDYDEAVKEAWRQDPALVTKVISCDAYEKLQKKVEIYEKAFENIRTVNSKMDCECGADDWPNEPVYECYTHESLRIISEALKQAGEI